MCQRAPRLMQLPVKLISSPKSFPEIRMSNYITLRKPEVRMSISVTIEISPSIRVVSLNSVRRYHITTRSLHSF